MFRVVNGFKVCMNSLKIWNGNNKLNMKMGIEAKKNELRCLDAMEGLVDWKRRNSVKNELDELLKDE